jgi:hypothetical protein
MIAAQILLAVAVLTTGLFTGLLVYIVGMFESMLTPLSGSQLTMVMGAFLPAARKNILNYLFTLASLFIPVVARPRHGPGTTASTPSEPHFH